MITTEIQATVKRPNGITKYVCLYVGLSTDDKDSLKPNTANSSIFKEMDTGIIWLFDEENDMWRKQS